MLSPLFGVPSSCFSLFFLVVLSLEKLFGHAFRRKLEI